MFSLSRPTLPSFCSGSLHLGHRMHSEAPQEAFPAAFPYPIPRKIRDSLGSSLPRTHRTPATCPTETAPHLQTPTFPSPSQSNAVNHSGVPEAKSTSTLTRSRFLQPSTHYHHSSLSSSILSTLALHPHSNDAIIPVPAAARLLWPQSRGASMLSPGRRLTYRAVSEDDHLPIAD